MKHVRVQGKIILLTFFILINFKVIAQLPTPNFCAVTVDTNTCKPILYWTVPDTNNIDGFIIKRIIYDGTGVIDGTLNNVAVLYDPKASRFIDTTTTYNTQALPCQRQETYVVTSFKQVNGTLQYSGFSQQLSTIYLSSYFDTCANSIILSWKKPSYLDTVTVNLFSAGKLQSLGQTNQDTFYYIPPQAGVYQFIISAKTNSCLIDTVISNLTKVEVNTSQYPKQLYIKGIEANHPDSIKINLAIDLPDDNPPTTNLLIDGQPIIEFDHDFNSYYSVSLPKGQQHTFQLVAKSSCGQLIRQSNIARNMVLRAEFKNEQSGQKIYLQWTSYHYWAGKTETYNIYFGSDSINLNYLAQTQDTFYVHDLSQLVQNGQLPSTVYYYVEAQETDNPQGQNTKSTSNIVQIPIPVLIFVPNTILPYSSNPMDQKFIIYANNIQNFHLQIFSRSGQLIFETSNLSNTWEGRYSNGQLVPPGTYIFIITYQQAGITKTMKGAVNVIY